MERTGLRRSASQDVLKGENVHLPTTSKSLSSKLSTKPRGLSERKPLLDKSNNNATTKHTFSSSSTKVNSTSITVFKDVHTIKKDTKTTSNATEPSSVQQQKENGHIDEFFEDNDVRYEKEPEMLPVPVLPILVPLHMRHLFRKNPQKRTSSDEDPLSKEEEEEEEKDLDHDRHLQQKKQRTNDDKENEPIVATTTVMNHHKQNFFNTTTPALAMESTKDAILLDNEQEIKSKQAQMQTRQPLSKSQLADPMRVAEYAQEIFQNLYDAETKILGDPNYAVHQQHEVTWKMRSVLIDWVIEIHYLFQLLPETLFLSVNIIDRFLSERTVVLGKLQLVGITSLYIATKFEEMTSPTLSDFLFMTDKAVREDELLKAERFILQVLDFRLCYPNPLNFLRRICLFDKACDSHTRILAKYFLEISCIDHRFIGVRPSMVASSALWLAHKMLARGRWTHELAQVSGYSAEQLKPTVEAMLDYLSQPVSHQAFYKKWSSRVYSKASVFVRDWINRYYVN